MNTSQLFVIAKLNVRMAHKMSPRPARKPVQAVAITLLGSDIDRDTGCSY